MSKKPTKQPSTIEQFLEAVRYLLVNDKGMPALVAAEVMAADDAYLRQLFGEGEVNGEKAMEAADELVIRPRKSGDWVCLGEDQMLLTINKSMRGHIENIGKVGLHGESDEEVVVALLARGIECLLPLVSLGQRR